jgi:hypothetical protein
MIPVKDGFLSGIRIGAGNAPGEVRTSLYLAVGLPNTYQT